MGLDLAVISAALFLLVLVAAWLAARALWGPPRGKAVPTSSVRYGMQPVAPAESFSRTNLVDDSALADAIRDAEIAVGGLSAHQRLLIQSFVNDRRVMLESFEIAEKTKDEITRASRLEVAKKSLERLEKLSLMDECPLSLTNSRDLWVDYHRLSSAVAPVAPKEADVDVSHFIGRSWGDVLAELTGGANLVDGRQTWELADEYKHDLSKMLECCRAELLTLERGGQLPAPFYFERAAILLRKAKQYQKEVQLVELYLAAADAWKRADPLGKRTVLSARHLKLEQRLDKARQLAQKQQGKLESSD